MIFLKALQHWFEQQGYKTTLGESGHTLRISNQHECVCYFYVTDFWESTEWSIRRVHLTPHTMEPVEPNDPELFTKLTKYYPQCTQS